MTETNILFQRQQNQLISEKRFGKPNEVVQWLGAVQAQDYLNAKWAIGLRLPGSSDDEITQAFNDGAILRTHVLRPTWHFVTPADIRWMLKLTAPRVHALSQYYYRKLELGNELFNRTGNLLITSLEGGKNMTRAEVALLFQNAGLILKDPLQVTLLIMHAELEGIICSGALKDKQHTYALLEERAAPTKSLEHDEALAQLSEMYFRSHGPATLKDYMWWSGISTADARAGLEIIMPGLSTVKIDDETYWFYESNLPLMEKTATFNLLPNYDEYLVGYAERKWLINTNEEYKPHKSYNIIDDHTIIFDGKVVGIWKRVLKKNGITITAKLFRKLSKPQQHYFEKAVKHYEIFMGKVCDVVLL